MGIDVKNKWLEVFGGALKETELGQLQVWDSLQEMKSWSDGVPKVTSELKL